jgi:hypothetical protein
MLQDVWKVATLELKLKLQFSNIVQTANSVNLTKFQKEICGSSHKEQVNHQT